MASVLKEIGSVICYRAGFAGDILLSTASLGWIKQKYPAIHLSYGLWRQYAEIVALSPHVNEIAVPGHYLVTDYKPNVVDLTVVPTGV